MIEQSKLITIMNALGYHADPRGVCFGLSSMAEQALFSGELQKFFDRITFIIENSEVVICWGLQTDSALLTLKCE